MITESQCLDVDLRWGHGLVLKVVMLLGLGLLFVWA